ncbi:MAG: ThiF family adenylyltransferase [Firmicutes bacterium]|nr:ThiF family adenylyltransferase [Bacillota bacterium]
MDDLLTRTRLLLGSENVETLLLKHVMVVGLGGVGGTALECLARSGIQHFILVDNDTVTVTNLNRQILFVHADIGKVKVDVAKQRLLAINPKIIVDARHLLVTAESIKSFEQEPIDFIVDAIDDIDAKAALIGFALEHNIPIISSLGMGKRLSAEAVQVTNLEKTHDDPLAKKLRHLLRAQNIDPKKVAVVFSKESPRSIGPQLSSMMMVPSAAGLQLAGYVLMSLSKITL